MRFFFFFVYENWWSHSRLNSSLGKISIEFDLAFVFLQIFTPYLYLTDIFWQLLWFLCLILTLLFHLYKFWIFGHFFRILRFFPLLVIHLTQKKVFLECIDLCITKLKECEKILVFKELNSSSSRSRKNPLCFETLLGQRSLNIIKY